jgi:hypothetical protein
MELETAAGRIADLAAENGGVVSAAVIEADPTLAEDRETTSAAAHMLAGGTNVFASVEEDGREWLPYSELAFTGMRVRRMRNHSS